MKVYILMRYPIGELYDGCIMDVFATREAAVEARHDFETHDEAIVLQLGTDPYRFYVEEWEVLE